MDSMQLLSWELMTPDDSTLPRMSVRSAVTGMAGVAGVVAADAVWSTIPYGVTETDMACEIAASRRAVASVAAGAMNPFRQSRGRRGAAGA